MTCKPQQHELLVDGGWGRCTPGLALLLPVGFCRPVELRLSEPQRQEIVKCYSILISRALKSVKKTVRENYQEHANEVKSSADTREVFMPAPCRTGYRWIPTRHVQVEWGSQGPGARPFPLASLPSLWILQRFPWDFFFFFFASLELNDISSSAGAAGRLEIVQ